MTAQQVKKKMGRPRKLAEDQAKLGVRLEQRDLAIIDMRSRGQKGRSEALRDLLRRYSAIIESATPHLSSRAWSFAIYALQGMLDEEADDTPELALTFDMAPSTVRTTLRDELEASVQPEQIEQAWTEYADLSDVELLAMVDVAQRLWSLPDGERTLDRVLDWLHVSDWAAPDNHDDLASD
ncbi:ribbon-helix-helix domain-containing protein [Azospirillum himalayense]|uniref:Ribbon-helix-helix domain-containing protein n=1 Tax=Azospirillum himalayense TaxID=654847 RepID=A0ABW0FY96_9PROT